MFFFIESLTKDECRERYIGKAGWNLQLNNIGFMEDNFTVDILRQKVLKNNFTIPMITSGENIALFWLKESNSVVLLNLQNAPNNGILSYDQIEIQVSMKNLEMSLISLDSFVTKFLTC